MSSNKKRRNEQPKNNKLAGTTTDVLKGIAAAGEKLKEKGELPETNPEKKSQDNVNEQKETNVATPETVKPEVKEPEVKQQEPKQEEVKPEETQTEEPDVKQPEDQKVKQPEDNADNDADKGNEDKNEGTEDEAPVSKKIPTPLEMVFKDYADNFGVLPEAILARRQKVILDYVNDRIGTEFGLDELLVIFNQYRNEDQAFAQGNLACCQMEWLHDTITRRAYLALMATLDNLANDNRKSLMADKIVREFGAKYQNIAKAILEIL